MPVPNHCKRLQDGFTIVPSVILTNIVTHIAKNSEQEVIGHVEAIKYDTVSRQRWVITELNVDYSYRERCIGRMLVKTAIDTILACNTHQPQRSDYVVIETHCLQESSLLYFWSICGFRIVNGTDTLRCVQW